MYVCLKDMKVWPLISLKKSEVMSVSIMYLFDKLSVVFDVPGVVAVALTEKKTQPLNESTSYAIRPSFILFYNLKDPLSPQVRKNTGQVVSLKGNLSLIPINVLFLFET